MIAFYGDNSIFPGKINVNATVTNNLLTVEVIATKGYHKPGITEELGVEFVEQIKKVDEKIKFYELILNFDKISSSDKIELYNKLKKIKTYLGYSSPNKSMFVSSSSR